MRALSSGHTAIGSGHSAVNPSTRRWVVIGAILFLLFLLFEMRGGSTKSDLTPGISFIVTCASEYFLFHVLNFVFVFRKY
jgi:hypothetical protein